MIFAAFFSSPEAERQKGGQNAYIEKGQGTGRSAFPWGSIGTNYLKGLFALAFQGFLIMVCVAIYAVLINNMIIAANIHSALFSVAAYTVILCFSLFKTGSLAKSLFNAH